MFYFLAASQGLRFPSLPIAIGLEKGRDEVVVYATNAKIGEGVNN
jgi:hypothetical protein